MLRLLEVLLLLLVGSGCCGYLFRWAVRSRLPRPSTERLHDPWTCPLRSCSVCRIQIENSNAKN